MVCLSQDNQIVGRIIWGYFTPEPKWAALDRKQYDYLTGLTRVVSAGRSLVGRTCF